MCMDPNTANLATQYVGQVAQGVSDYRTGKLNAQYASAEGRSAQQAGNAQSQKIENEGQRFLSTTQSNMAASGVDTSSGSAADVQAESAKNIELDRLTALYQGNLQKWQKDQEVKQYKRQARAGAGMALGTLGGGIIGGKITGTILGA